MTRDSGLLFLATL